MTAKNQKASGLTSGLLTAMGMMMLSDAIPKEYIARKAAERAGLPFRVPSNAPLEPPLPDSTDYAELSRKAGEEFEMTGDRYAALAIAALLIRSEATLPPNIARWISAGFMTYVTGKASALDQAFGLNGSGKANARRLAIEKMRTERVISAMQALHMMGASISQAAEMACRFRPHLSVATAIDVYSRSGRGKKALADRKSPDLAYWDQCMKGLVDPLPDDGGDPADKQNPIRLGKAKIKKLYSKLSASRT
jgi:hypothetical protein